MARLAKSLIPPEQGYSHRDHRSAKGRNQNNHPINKKRRNRRKKILERKELGYGRKGKWI